MLHIKLKGMKHRATLKLFLHTPLCPEVGSKGHFFENLKMVMLHYQIKVNEV